MLKKETILSLFTALILTAAPAAGAASEALGPSAFLPERVHTFEPVLEGAEVVHEFVLQNVGDEILFIEKLKSG